MYHLVHLTLSEREDATFYNLAEAREYLKHSIAREKNLYDSSEYDILLTRESQIIDDSEKDIIKMVVTHPDSSKDDIHMWYIDKIITH